MTDNLNPNSREFVGLILAGGHSSRMGKDKAALEINGQTLLGRSLNLLHNLGAVDILISRNAFVEGSLPDIYPHQGPLSGIHSALFDSLDKHQGLPILVIPIDMPLLNDDLLICLVEAGLTMDCAVNYVQHPLPLFIPNSNTAREYLEQVLSDVNGAKSSRSILRFLKHIDAAQLSTNENDKLINTNTPEQWLDFINHQSIQDNNE